MTAITLLVLALYSNTLKNGFNIDDPNILLNNSAVQGLTVKNVKAVFTSVPNTVEYLPVRDLTYSLDYEFWGLDPLGYHLSNMLYYLFTCLLLYLFLTRLFKWWSVEPGLMPFFATVLFVVHPVHVESVAGIAQRKDLVSGMFFFLSLLGFLSYMEKRERVGERGVAGGRAGGGVSLVLSLLFFIAAYLSKATVVFLPGVIFLLNHFHPKGKEESPARRWLETGLFFLVAGVMTYLHVTVFSGAGIILKDSGGLLQRIPVALTALYHYAGLLVYPYPLTVWYEIDVGPWLSALVVLAACGIMAALWVGVKLKDRLPHVSFSIAFVLLAFFPVVGLVGASTLVAERYMFLPVAGFSMLVAWLLHRLLSSGQRPLRIFVTAAFVVVLMAFFAISVKRNTHWRSVETLLLADLAKAPGSVKLTRMLGRYYFVNKRHNEAFEYLKRVNDIQKGDIDYNFYLALFLYEKGKYTDALFMLDSLGLKEAGVIDMHYLYGRIFEALGRGQDALQSYRAALRGTSMNGVFFKRDAREALMALQNGQKQ